MPALIHCFPKPLPGYHPLRFYFNFQHHLVFLWSWILFLLLALLRWRGEYAPHILKMIIPPRHQRFLSFPNRHLLWWWLLLLLLLKVPIADVAPFFIQCWIKMTCDENKRLFFLTVYSSLIIIIIIMCMYSIPPSHAPKYLVGFLRLIPIYHYFIPRICKQKLVPKHIFLVNDEFHGEQNGRFIYLFFIILRKQTPPTRPDFFCFNSKKTGRKSNYRSNTVEDIISPVLALSLIHILYRFFFSYIMCS